MSSAGQIVGGIVGAVVGFYVGGPQGAVMGAQVGLGVGGYIDPPKGPTINGPRLSDLSAQTSTYGSPIPRIYGTVATHGNVIWLQGNQLTEVARKEKQGGKGGGGGATVKTYSYYATFAVGLADVSKTGPIQGVRRIWVGGNLIYDAGSDDLETIIASNQAAKGFRIYFGDEDQMPDPRMQADLGVANCPAYRGLAYIVFYDFSLKDYGNSLMAAQVKVEVVNAAYITSPGWELASVDQGINYRSVASSDTGWLVLGTNTILHSEDGKTWVEKPFTGESAFGGAPYGVTSFGEEWFGVGANTLITGVWKSGFHVSTTPGGLATYRDVTSFGPYVVAVGVAGAVLRLRPSVERITPNPVSFDMYGVCADGHGFIACGASGNIAISVNGEQWSALVSPTSENLNSIHHHEGTTIAVGQGGTVIRMLDDGEGFALIAAGLGSVTLTGITNADGVWYAVQESSTDNVHRSDDDGLTWTIETAIAGNSRAIAFGRATVVIVGDAGKVISKRLSSSVYPDTITLSSIVSAECLQSGLLTTQDIDVSDISQDVRGYRVAGSGAIRGAIEPLQGAWPFDVIQAGYKIKFVRRGKTSIATIDALELDARQADSGPGVQITLANEMDTQLPRAVSLKYLDIGREYDISEQNAERLNTDAVNLREMEMPIVLSATEAAGMSEVLLYLYWLERRDVSFRLPPEYRYLEPADVITITGEWGQYELRLTRINLESDGRLACYAKFNAAAIYTPAAQGAEGEAPPQTIPLDGPSVYIMLDVPLLSDSYNSPGWPAAMAGYTAGWPGGVIYRSVDGGQTWTDLQGFTSPVTMGYARGALGAGRFDIVDASSVLGVDMVAGDLSSIDELAQFAGGNALAYGAPGRWEICSPRTVTLNADGSLRMTDWLRGRFGTEWAASLHQSGDALVLLTDPDLAWISMESGAIGLARDYRGITAGRAIDTDDNRSETYNAVNLQPLSPVYLNGSRHPSTRDWELSWTRRGRVSPDWRGSVDVPVGEASEAYEVEIYDGSGYTTVKRTLTSSTPAVAYTSDQQVTDFGSNQGTLYVRVYQLSATVGRGYPLTTSITRG